MSDDLAQTLLCLSFTIPAFGILVLVFFRNSLRSGSDVESSAAVLDEDEFVQDGYRIPPSGRRAVTASVWVCLGLIALVTVVTLVVAGKGSAAAGSCPLGF